MAVGTQVTDFADLRRELLSLMRQPTGNTSINDIANRYLNEALRDIHIAPGKKFPWTFRRNVVTTHAPYETGTVSISDTARTTVNGGGTEWNTAVPGFGFNNVRAGGKMVFGGSDEIYVVSSVTNDLLLTLESRWTGDALSSSSYTYYEDEYALVSDFRALVDSRNFSTDMKIPLISPLQFRERYPTNSRQNKPAVATTIHLGFSGTTAPRHRVVFHPTPDNEYSIPYDYMTTNLAVTSAGLEQTQLVNDTDEPIIPLDYRHIIPLRAAWKWLEFRKDDVRAAEIKTEYIDLMRRMTGDLGITQDRPQFIFSSGRRKMPVRGRFDVNGWFDKLKW